MNKSDKMEYKYTSRQVKRRRTDNMYNEIHDTIYTFADEYYEELRRDYVESMKDSLKDEEFDK